MRILLTGIDGAGKSTAAHDLALAIHARGGTALVLKNPAGRRTMAGWWDAVGWTPGPRLQDFLETTTRVVRVLLNEVQLSRFDGVAILDRGLDCQLALREARGLPRGVIIPWLQRAMPAPDVVAHFELPAEIAVERVNRRGTDRETPSGLDSLQQAYRRLETYPASYIVQAADSREAITAELLALAARDADTGQDRPLARL
ncbi:thymidylate kinase [Arthrobacter agilis]|uniref:thymidylate kinase n=1 Tax=Arthrobacter agilis TaxID=37921 RepID=UPI002785211F|nr:thymidylate kinase [Arthrobacter agilis]MDQ0735960.1 dTMP kinase [Arthrobacter agilis]